MAEPRLGRHRWRWPRGLRTRLTLAIAAILAAALSATFAATYRGTGNQVRATIDNELRQQVDSFLGGIPPGATTAPAVTRAARRHVARQSSFGPAAELLVVRVAGGPTVTNHPELGSAPDGDTTLESRDDRREEARESRALRHATPGYSTIDLGDAGPTRVLVAPVRRGGRLVATFEVGESLASVARARDGVARTFLLAGSITLVLAALVGYLVAARTSRPLRRMAGTAAAVDAGDLTHRMRARGPVDEVRVLADAFDRMLDRLSDAFARQRGFVADASHELRTPLTVIRGQLEVLARQPDVSRDDVRRVERTVRTEVARMERLVEDLLLLARADEGQLVRPEPVELEPFVSELFDGITLTADRRFELADVPSGVLHADADRVAQVVRNLARNAVEHTEPGGLVRLTVTRHQDAVELAIEDDGPGIPEHQRARIFDRFHRTDAARARGMGGSGGAGLGLAIALTIVEDHGGRIYAGRSPEGGARVAFELPGYTPAAERSPAPAPAQR